MTASHLVAPAEAALRVPPAPGRFDLDELAGLPLPVARYFRHAIAVGAPLAQSATLAMHGRLKLNGRWLSMRASEVLAPHVGLVWRARIGRVIVGSDRGGGGEGAMDWRLLGLLRVMHAEGPDIARSATGRAAGEALWVPTALLPRFGVAWEALTDTHLTARFTVGGVEHTLHVTTTPDGAVESARLDRWGDPDETGTWGPHPFGFVATETRRFGALTIPAVGSAGWFLGSERWADGEFFRCTITALTPT